MKLAVIASFFLLFASIARANEPATTRGTLPTLYIIGDSTVHNTGNGLVGWGDRIGAMFDANKVDVQNRAIAGRSSRTFMNEGRWDKIMETLKPGDFVLMQFGHNDGGEINDNTRARGSLRGVGDDTQEIDNQMTGKHETVHTFGWYMRKFEADAKSKGATPIVCSLVARNMWKDGKVIRSPETYAGWAKQIAADEHVPYIDLNDLTATKYEQMGEEKVKELFPGDHTHTNADGAALTAEIVAEEIRQQNNAKLKQYLKP